MTAAAMVRRTRSLQQDYLPSPVAVHMCTLASPGQGRAFPTPRAGVKGNALRLCLTNNIWTACRLLIVKGTLATVVCEGHTRQLAFDTLAKYNVLKIGTPGSIHVTQCLTLPILRSLDANTPGLQSINHLLQQARRPSTKKSHNSKVDKFQDFVVGCKTRPAYLVCQACQLPKQPSSPSLATSRP
jgi:hypothetical protein